MTLPQNTSNKATLGRSASTLRRREPHVGDGTIIPLADLVFQRFNQQQETRLNQAPFWNNGARTIFQQSHNNVEQAPQESQELQCHYNNSSDNGEASFQQSYHNNSNAREQESRTLLVNALEGALSLFDDDFGSEESASLNNTAPSQ